MRGKSLSVESRLALLSCLELVWLFQLINLLSATDTLNPGGVLRDWDSLESPNTFFMLGFFNPFPSSNHYLAIRCNNSFNNKTNWVANRDNPLSDSSGYLSLTHDGFLVIRNERGASLTINSREPAMHPNKTLVLLDSGNLVLKAGQQIVWQSFDYPTDTILPGMKIGLFDLKNQTRNRFLTSWISPQLPSSGAFTLGVNPNNTKQLEVRRRGTPYWRSPTWQKRKNESDLERGNVSNNNYFPWKDYLRRSKFSYTANENESYFSYSVSIGYKYSWIEINSTGNIIAFFDDGRSASGPAVMCDAQKEDSSEGCIEQKASKCSVGDKFVREFGSMNIWSISNNVSMSLSDCEQECRNDCSCTAYASNSPDGTGCKFSYGGRINPSVKFSERIYVRHTKGSPWKKIIVIGGPIFLTCSLCYILWKYFFPEGKIESSQNQIGRDTQKYLKELGTSIAAMDGNGSHSLMIKGKTDNELPMFGFSTIETATEHFSEENKLGRGGFGPVYKGKLVDGQEIAVKRLSERSSQGTEEFKNEVVLISKVQHRNLVRLYGCCIEGGEKLLVYEYLPNKSLDTFLFDETKRVLLDWKLRMKIIGGISQGLVYLHEFSRLKIIHRDLKTSNILLDNNMNPKISDFGTAKIFGENESRASTNRIVGTYGYMSPEYAMDGLFSVKSDVFSFGVMMLEILSGKKNTGFYHSDQVLNLTKHAWNLWKEERGLELMDPILAETYCSTFEFERYVHIALLCVQENASDRPNMSDVTSMLLGSDATNLPELRQSNISALQTDHPQSSSSSSVNGLTVTTTYAR